MGQSANQPTQPMGAPQNVFQGSAQAMQQAGQTFGGLAQGAGGQYMQDVINRTQQDIMRQQQMAQNQLDAQATAAGAFGGSRHGIAQGVMAGEYGRMAGDIAAQQRMQGQELALRAAGGLGTLGQQAFGMGQATQAAVGQQGEFQRALQQQIIDAAKGQYAGAAGTPLAGLGALTSVLGASRFPTTTTTTATGTQPYDPSALFATMAYRTVLGGSPAG